MQTIRLSALLWVGLASVSLVHAEPILPDSYYMQNGGSDPVNGHYWDDLYPSPNASTDYGFLSGGSGELTDGVIATQNWNQNSAPYVGWSHFNPEIVFNFTHLGSRTIQTITFYTDDANGAGGVNVPASIEIGGNLYTVTDPVGSAPTSFTFSNLDLSLSNGNLPDGYLTININRSDAWLFVSEITFDTSAVPEPGSLALFGLGGAMLRRRQRQNNAGREAAPRSMAAEA